MFKTPIVFVIAIISAIATDSVADWSQFQGDAGHTAYVAGYFDASNVRQTWSLPLAQSLDIAANDGYLYVTQAGSGFESTATVSRLDRFTGAVEWSTSVPYQSPYGVSAPTIQGDIVYVHRWGHSGISGSTQPEKKPSLVGIDAKTGTQLFSTQHSGQWNSGSRPTIEGDTLFAAGGYYGGMDAYELDGTHKWSASVNQQYGWIPAADSENVYTYMGEASASPGPSVGRLYIFDRETGVRTSIDHPRSTGTLSRSSDNGSVMLDGSGNAYALWKVTGGNTLVSFDISGGGINWEADGYWVDNPAIADGVIALPEKQSLVFLDATTGTRLWNWEHGADVTGSVILTDNVAFAGTKTGVYAIDLVSHSTIWSTPIQGKLAAVDQMLYITNGTGIYAFDFPESLLVAIDIKPGSDGNSINLTSNGNIAVAIYSTDDFDATTVNPATIRLADAGVLKQGKSDNWMSSFEDINMDGLLDLLVHINTQALILNVDDTEAKLTGKTFDGLLIGGTDAISLVGKSAKVSMDTPICQNAGLSTVTPIPEPGTFTLLVSGVLMLLGFAIQQRERSTGNLE